MTWDKFKEQAQGAAGLVVGQAKNAASSVVETAGKASALGKEKAQEILPSLLAEMVKLKPILWECGFMVKDVSLTLSLIPELAVVIEQTGRGKQTLEQMALAGETSLNPLQSMVLNSLIKANELVQITDKYGYTFRQYQITLTLPPKVQIHLVANDRR